MRYRIRWLCLMLVHLFGAVSFSVVKNHDTRLKILETWVAVAQWVPFAKANEKGIRVLSKQYPEAVQ